MNQGDPGNEEKFCFIVYEDGRRRLMPLSQLPSLLSSPNHPSSRFISGLQLLPSSKDPPSQLFSVSIHSPCDSQYELHISKSKFTDTLPESLTDTEPIRNHALELRLVRVSKDVLKAVEEGVRLPVRRMQLLFLSEGDVRLIGSGETVLRSTRREHEGGGKICNFSLLLPNLSSSPTRSQTRTSHHPIRSSSTKRPHPPTSSSRLMRLPIHIQPSPSPPLIRPKFKSKSRLMVGSVTRIREASPTPMLRDRKPKEKSRQSTTKVASLCSITPENHEIRVKPPSLEHIKATMMVDQEAQASYSDDPPMCQAYSNAPDQLSSFYVSPKATEISLQIPEYPQSSHLFQNLSIRASYRHITPIQSGYSQVNLSEGDSPAAKRRSAHLPKLPHALLRLP